MSKSTGKGTRETLGNCEVPEKSEAIRTAAVALEDDIMITMTTKLADFDCIAKEVKYHHSCRRTYLRRAERLAEGSKRSETSKLHEDAYGTNGKYITSTLVDNKRAELLTSLHAQHMTILGSDESTYPARSLSAKIVNTFPCALQQTSNKTGVIIYNASLTEESGIRQACIAEHSIKESALHLGSLIADGCTVRTSRSTHCCCTSHRSIKTSSGTTGFVPVIQRLHKLRVLNDRYNPLLMMLSMLSHEAGPNQQSSCVLESRV